MIKCPQCGSTAQVEIKGNPFVRCQTEQLGLTCVCGCGCEFNVLYNYSHTEIKN